MLQTQMCFPRFSRDSWINAPQMVEDVVGVARELELEVAPEM